MTDNYCTPEDRDQLLKKLHNIVFAAFLTYLPTECCLEVVTMTNKGTAWSWIAEDEWKVYELREIGSARWNRILSNIKTGSLCLDDIQETDLEKLVNELFDEDVELSAELKPLCELTSAPTDKWYCYCDSSDNKLFFYNSIEDLAIKLADEYSRVDSLWEDLDDAILKAWVARYDLEEIKIPCCYFSNDE